MSLNSTTGKNCSLNSTTGKEKRTLNLIKFRKLEELN